MVLFWTQLDGENQDPKERLAATRATPTIEGGTPKNGMSPEDHPKVDGRPPSGRITKIKSKKSLSPTSTPKNFFRRSKSKTLPSRGSSKRQVVSVKAIDFPTPKATGSPSPSSDDDCLSSPETYLNNGSSPILAESSSSSDTDNSTIVYIKTSSCESPPSVGMVKSLSIVDSLKIKQILVESPERVKLGRNGSIKSSKKSPNFVVESDEDDSRDTPDEGYFTKKKKRFYSTLPRNWKSHAVDLFKTKGKTFCEHCKKKCSGEVLRVHDKYFHVACFNCQHCKKTLAQGGFFSRESKYFCTDCYQDKFGQLCATCGKYVEGEVVSALGNTYHQKCFLCARCRQPFPSGERVTYTGQECLCQKCYHIPTVDSQSPTRSPTSAAPKCAGCKDELIEGQALIALDQQWHIWCFKCASCNTLLHGEYMGKDGLPYCEKDYQSKFGVKCAYCSRFITGKVLQAGDNHHFHPTCARCTKCGDPFGDGEEMYLQGTAIWHPRCGPGPTENGTVLNGSLSNGHHMNGDQKTERDFDGMSSTASETQFSRSRTPSLNGSMRSCSPYNSLNRKSSVPYRTCSPGLILREYKSSQSPIDISRIYTYSFLTAEPTQSYLKKPIDPYDRPPKSPHFHRPIETGSSRRMSLPKASSRLGMKVLVATIQSETPRPKSPKMNNEEPIILSHYPGGKPTKEGQSRIERDDFPAPPYAYTDPERRRRWSGSSKGSKGLSLDETDDGIEDDDVAPIDHQLKKEEAELSKISTGIGKVFLQQVKEREKIRAYKITHVDPRNASRTPSANREPGYRMRFESSINASPSRLTDHSRPWDEDDFEPGSSYRCSSAGRSSATLPSYNVVSSLRGDPKPGYGLKSSTLPGRICSPNMGDYQFSGLGEKTQSTDFSSARSDVSACSLTEADRTALNVDLCPSATYSSGLRGYSYSPHFRRSLPNMHHMASDPPKIYPAHLLFTNNYRLPNDVDRCHLERHLSDADFELVFHCTRIEFYRMPEWKRNDIKRRTRLF